MAETFEEIVIRMLGKIDSRLNGIDARLDGNDEMFAKILNGMAPTMETTTEHSLQLKDHEQRINHLESA